MKDAIAIIGMGCIFPDTNNTEEYWENIIKRHSAIGELPKERWDPALYYHPGRWTPYKSYSKIGANIKGFKKDPLKFRIPPVSEPFIDRVQFLMLEVTHQALEDAGYLKKKFPRERTAIFVGNDKGGELTIRHHIRAHWRQFAESLKSTSEFRELPKELKDSILDKSEKIKVLNVWLDYSLKRRWDGQLNDPKELEKVRNHCKRLLIGFGDL